MTKEPFYICDHLVRTERTITLDFGNRFAKPSDEMIKKLLELNEFIERQKNGL